jgi:cephalosporin hydroxylase
MPFARLRGRRNADPAEQVERPLPTPIELDLNQSFQRYYQRRAVQSAQDWYAGVRMAKFPEDLRVYEHLLWESCVDTVIEIGAAFGGSALWFRDRMRAMEEYGRIPSPSRVISIDVDVERPRELLAAADPDYEERISLVAGDVRDPELTNAVEHLVPANSRCMVVEDSAHIYETTMGALKGFARFVPRGGYFVVEDGYVDVPEMVPGEDLGWGEAPKGVLPALDDWLRTREGKRFEVRRDLELYGLTSHPRGFLQRVRRGRSV